jgi:hypothetical protein
MTSLKAGSYEIKQDVIRPDRLAVAPTGLVARLRGIRRKDLVGYEAIGEG